MQVIDMAKADNLADYLADIANAIREKKGTNESINAQDFASEIASIESGGNGWTGHADVEGLKAIGWTDNDIDYYQKYGVNWNEEDDELHKVTDDNKALYGVLTADNISSHRDRIVYLPKIDTRGVTSMSGMFSNCYSLVAIPSFETRSVTNMDKMFSNCYSLTSIPNLSTGRVISMNEMFSNCHSLTYIPYLDTITVTNMYKMFSNCYSLTSIPQFDTRSAIVMAGMFSNCYSLTSIPQLTTPNVTVMDEMFSNCYSLTSIQLLNTRAVNRTSAMFNGCFSLTTARLLGVAYSYDLRNSPLLTKDSLIFIINSEAAMNAITIALAAYAYVRLANDRDITAALARHPNITLAR